MAFDTEAVEFKLVRKNGGVVLDLIQGLWTEAQYLRLTDQTNQLIEFTDGSIEVLPMPTRTLQPILAFLYRTVIAFMPFKGGIVLFAPMRLQIAPGRFREPDLLLLLDAHDPRRQNRYWMGADLVVEIVSPDKPERDLIDKRIDYAEASIPEYWIIDPRAVTITVLRLENNTYTEHGVFGRGTVAISVLLEGFEVSVDAVFDAE